MGCKAQSADGPCRLLEACKARERPAPRFSHPQAGFGQVRRKRSKFKVSFSLMTLAFLVVFQAGWRCLYGFAKAHDSLVPKPVQRRLEAQEARDRGESDGTAGSD